jgi:hypothetical protein
MRSTCHFVFTCLLTCLFLLALRPANAQSDLLFTLDSIVQSGNPGDELIYTGTLTNTSSNPLYLNGITFNFDNAAVPYLSGDANVFNANVPLSLAASGSAGDSYSGAIFGVALDPSTPPGTYTGSVTLTGGADGNANDVLGTQNFGVATPAGAVPEASSLSMAVIGLLSVGIVRRRTRSSLNIAGRAETDKL